MSLALTLTRDELQPFHYCTFGRLDVAGLDLFETIELPWLPASSAPCGLIGHSCIAKGTYKLEHRFTEARREHFIISNPELGIYRYEADIPAHIYGRCLVLIHVANWAHELAGCIAPGENRDIGTAEACVTSSAVALRKIIGLVGKDKALTMEIK